MEEAIVRGMDEQKNVIQTQKRTEKLKQNQQIQILPREKTVTKHTHTHT